MLLIVSESLFGNSLEFTLGRDKPRPYRKHRDYYAGAGFMHALIRPLQAVWGTSQARSEKAPWRQSKSVRHRSGPLGNERYIQADRGGILHPVRVGTSEP
jgi:hypothetical protein